MKPNSINFLTRIEVFDEIPFWNANPNGKSFTQGVLISDKDRFRLYFLKELTNTLNRIFSKLKPKFKSKKTILIAEDEEFNFLYLKTILSSHNFNLLRAHNGKEAVEICTSNSNIDLILMDIKMPIMNGFEATTKIHKLMPDLPIIAQTAYSTANDKKKAFSCGCSDFLSKPFTQEDLIEKITNHI